MVCELSLRLRKDGTVQAHRAHTDGDRHPDCEGTGKQPRPYNPNECFDCMTFYYGTPGLVEAIWSTAIESPKSGEQLTREFLESYHLSGHKEDFLNGG
jgi:hypothetical protein